MKHPACLIAFVLVLPVARAQNPPAPLVSPEIQTGRRVTFRLRAPQAKEVALRGQWAKDPVPLARGEEGVWSVALEAVPAGVWEYSFAADGLNLLDSLNPAFKPQREPQKSILHVPSTPPAPWDWQDLPHGTVHQHGYASQALGRARECLVYTPPGYEREAGKKYPLLVLQHGSGDNHQTWIAHGKAHWILDHLIAERKAVPMVVLMLDGHPLGMVPRGGDARRRQATEAFRRELFEDALPLVEASYRVEKDPALRAIAGLSMGGGQSLSIGLGNLDRFAWVGAFSAGPPSAEALQAFLADAATANARLSLLWIACGKDDFLLQRNEEFTAALKEKGIRHDWLLTEGDHSWPVWRRYLADFAPRLFARRL
jgi:enterochelin esterase family protein